MFDFKRLIDKYSKSLPQKLSATGEGHYDYENGGIWVESTGVWTEFEGAVVPLDRDDLKYLDNNVYTSHDRKVYCYEDMNLNDKIKHKDMVYTIQEMSDYSDYADGLRIYYMRKGS